MNVLRPFHAISLALALAGGGSLPAIAQADLLTVFAAASLREALDDVAIGFEKKTGADVTLSYAGSSSLARQIEAGAPADVFVSANAAWMDALEAEGHVQPGTRFDLLGNALVLVGPARGAPEPVTLNTENLKAALQDGKLALALVDAVPAGIYGKQALQTLGIWDDLSGHVAQTDNVRAALALVAIGAAPLGMVYATDAQADDRVTVRAPIAAKLHDEILYPAAATTQSNSAHTQAFLDYLRSPPAEDIFVRHGFTVQSGKD